MLHSVFSLHIHPLFVNQSVGQTWGLSVDDWYLWSIDCFVVKGNLSIYVVTLVFWRRYQKVNVEMISKLLTWVSSTIWHTEKECRAVVSVWICTQMVVLVGCDFVGGFCKNPQQQLIMFGHFICRCFFCANRTSSKNKNLIWFSAVFFCNEILSFFIRININLKTVKILTK